MAEQRFVIDGQAIVVDPATLSKDQLETLTSKLKMTHEYALETRPGLPKPPLPGRLDPRANSLENLLDQNPESGMLGKIDTDGLRKRLMGMGIGGVTGGPVGAAIGTMSPPETTGEGFGSILAGVLGNKLGPGVQAMKGLKGMLASGGVGLLENIMQQGGEKAGQMVTGDPAQGNPQGGVNTAISTILPMLTKGMIQAPAAASKNAATAANTLVDNSKSALSKILGKEVQDPTALRTMTDAVTPPTNAPGKSLLSPYGRVFGKLVNQTAKVVDERAQLIETKKETYNKLLDAARRTGEKTKQLSNFIAQDARATKRAVGETANKMEDMEREIMEPFMNRAVETMESLGASGKTLDDHTLDTVTDMADAIRKRQTVYAAKRQEGNLKKGLPFKGKGPLDINAPDPLTTENFKQQKEATQLQALQEFNDARLFDAMEVKPLARQLRGSPEIDPNLKHFVGRNVNNVDDFEKQLTSSTPMNIVVLRKALGGDLDKPTPAIKAFEEGFSRQFAKMALGPDGTLSNIDSAAKAFTYDKIRALYGGGARGIEKAETFQHIVDSTRQLMDANKEAKSDLSMKAIGNIPYLVVRASLTRDPITSLGKAGAATAGTYLVTSWSKMIDHAVNNKSFGHQFEEWAASGSVTDTLRNFPLVEKFFKENNDYKSRAKEAVAEEANRAFTKTK